MEGLKKFSLLSPQPSSSMPTAQELKKAQEALDAQIAAVEQEEREAKEARLQAGSGDGPGGDHRGQL